MGSKALLLFLSTLQEHLEMHHLVCYRSQPLINGPDFSAHITDFVMMSEN